MGFNEVKQMPKACRVVCQGKGIDIEQLVHVFGNDLVVVPKPLKYCNGFLIDRDRKSPAIASSAVPLRRDLR